MEEHVTIGFAGHVDHGKTTLVRCLTGVDTDRKREEKLRGMSIEAGVAPLSLPSGRKAAVIDVPGHTDYLKNTIRGLNSVDVGVLVVAADDGVMPQTLEHLEILKFFNASSGFVVLSKIDLVDEETADMAELEIKDLLSGTFLEHQPVYRFSARRPEMAADILGAIDAAAGSLPAKKRNLSFRLWIDQVKSLAGHGTIVSGTVLSGSIRCNEMMELLPSGVKTRSRSLESHACPVTCAVAGQRVGINLHRVSLDHVRRGMCLTVPDAVVPAHMLNADIRVLKTAQRGIKNRQKVKIYIGTAMVNAMVVLMEAERIDPGKSGLVQLRLIKPVAALPQDAFVVVPLNLNTVIAGGRILEAPREKYRTAKSATILPGLSALSQSNLDAYIERVFAVARGNLITAKALSVKTGLALAPFERRINADVRKGELVYFKGLGAIRAAHLDDLKKQIESAVEAAFKKDPLKKNIALSEIADRLNWAVDAPLLKIAAEALCTENRLERYLGGYRDVHSETELDTHRQTLIALLLEYARTSELVPFSADTFWKSHQNEYDKGEVSQLLNYLNSRKKLARLNDNRFLSLEAVAKIKTRVACAIEDRGFITVSDCKDLLGYGRWGGTHVLDYLNDIGFTVRRENKHYLNHNGV